MRNTDGSTKLEKEVKSCMSLSGQLDIQMEISYEVVFKGKVKLKVGIWKSSVC